MAMNPGKAVMGFAMVVFVLLGILFGAQIMTFIFAQLGPANAGLTASDAGYNTSLEIQNDSLYAISQYSGQSGTQFLVIGIAITLLILILLFVVFWKYFMKDTIGQMGGGSSSGSFG